MKNFLLAIAFLFTGYTAEAQLVPLFQSMEQNRKGPFDMNMLQGSKSRINVLHGQPAGRFQFQAAFRNQSAQVLAGFENFYVGNLFTTNYYELMGEYVFGDARSSHELDHESLMAVSSAVIAKADSMVRHWALEKHYIHQLPESKIAASFKLRGISDMANELEYAHYFFNFYLSALSEDSQYLTAWVLAQGSPLFESKSLETARVSIAKIYEAGAQSYGAKSTRGRRLYQLRNAIHNQLSKSVIGLINDYMKDYPGASENRGLTKIRDILVEYYNVGPNRIVAAAEKLGDNQIRTLAQKIGKNGNSLSTSLELSKLATDLRTMIMHKEAIPWSQKTDALSLLLTISQYLNKEVLVLSPTPTIESLKITLNLIYIEGLLIRDNWDYFMGDLNQTSDIGSAIAIMTDVVGIAGDSFATAYEPALNQWIQVEPKMGYFIDNAIKSSSLNTASVLMQR